MTRRQFAAHRGIALGAATPVLLRGRRSRTLRHEAMHLAEVTVVSGDDDLLPIWLAGRVAGSALVAVWWVACMVGEVVLLGVTVAGAPAGVVSLMLLAVGATPSAVATVLLVREARSCPDRVHLDARSGDRPPSV